MCHLVKGIFITTLVYQGLELAIPDPEELAWLAEFDDVSGVKDQLHKSVSTRQAKEHIDIAYDFISIHDGLQPVGDREQRHIRPEVGTERILDHRVRLVVDGRSGYTESS